MRDKLTNAHQALNEVERNPLVNLSRAVAVVRTALVAIEDLSRRIDALERKGVDRLEVNG
jgi:predicted RNA polymerase sigma factor